VHDAQPDPDSPATSDPRRRHATLIVAAVSVLAVDIATKVAASTALANRSIELPGPVDLRLSYNPGVAFGVGDSLPTWLILALTTAVAVAIAVAAWRGFFASSLAAGVVVGGAIANVADRAQAGTVVDMLYTGWWPTFNVADIAVVCGGFALAITGWRAASDEPDAP
jgi:signal peptidase II